MWWMTLTDYNQWDKRKKNMNKISKESVQVVTQETTSSSKYQVLGSEIEFFYVPPVSDPGFKTNSNSHFWATILGLYSNSIAELYNIDVNSGGFDNTSFSDIYGAYNNTGMYVASTDAFRTQLNKDFRMTIPISGGTGELSGLTTTNLYSGLFNQSDSLKPMSKGICALVKADEVYSEYHPIMDSMGVGYKLKTGVNPIGGVNAIDNVYSSGVVTLFSDTLNFSGATTGSTWGSGWSGTSRYTSGGKLAELSGSYDKAMGVLDLHGGIIAIWNSDLVSSFNTAVATGGTVSSGLTFSTTDCSAIVSDFDYQTVLNVNVTLPPNQFVGENSQNQSRAEAAKDGTCDDSVKITDVCFYDKQGVLMAKGILNEPVTKSASDFFTATAVINMDGGYRDDLAEDGRVVY